MPVVVGMLPVVMMVVIMLKGPMMMIIVVPRQVLDARRVDAHRSQVHCGRGCRARGRRCRPSLADGRRVLFGRGTRLGRLRVDSRRRLAGVAGCLESWRRYVRVLCHIKLDLVEDGRLLRRHHRGLRLRCHEGRSSLAFADVMVVVMGVPVVVVVAAMVVM